MSLFSALNTSASGMLAQSKSTAMVSQNIANLTTTGYKRSEATFFDLLGSSKYSTGYQPGAVTAHRILRTEQSGTIQSTNSTSDAAILGNGFFVVSKNPGETADNSTAPGNLYFTRNGSFGETYVRDTGTGESGSYLSNSAGMYLYGWPIDTTTGTVTAGQDFTSLVPIELSTFQTTSLPTTTMSLALNLDADETNIDMHTVTGGATQLPASSQEPSFTRSFAVYDQNGAQQNLSFEYRKIAGPMAHFTTNFGVEVDLDDVFVPTSGGGIFSGIADGDSFTVDVGGTSETYTFVSEATGDDPANNQIATIEGFLDALRDHGVDTMATPPVTNGLLSVGFNDGRLLVRSNDPTATITLTEDTGTPLQGNNTLNIIGDPDDPLITNDLIFEPDEDITNPTIYPDQGDFPALANTTDPVADNWWELTVVNPLTGATLRQGLLNFNADGSLNATPDADGTITLDLASTPIDLNGDGTADDAITVDMTRTSQFAGSYQIISAEQNGAPLGSLSNIEIADDGRVIGVFSNGVRSDLYQIPVATFANANGLNDESGTIFSITEDSGMPILSIAGEGAAGTLRGAAIETSNVDVGEEFGRMVISQRGYSLNSQVIQAIDEMTERLVQL
jgi:flagellar hook protein FlgE